MARTITVCPECGEVDIERRTNGPSARTHDADTKWWCWNCDTAFDEPAERDGADYSDNPGNLSAAGRAAFEQGRGAAGGDD